jgi:hypothetical protein
MVSFLDRHGARLMVGEVALLIAASLAAMATDSYWARRAAGKVEEKAVEKSDRNE